jgi:hypothetical protein
MQGITGIRHPVLGLMRHLSAVQSTWSFKIVNVDGRCIAGCGEVVMMIRAKAGRVRAARQIKKKPPLSSHGSTVI